MRLGEIRRLVEGTADAAFAIDPNGLIAAWNGSAAEVFGFSAQDAIGKYCSDVVRGIDECGRACSNDCSVRQQARNGSPLKSYDVQVSANGERRWFNVSVLIVESTESMAPYTVHLARPADLQKRFELLMRDFVVNETNLPSVNVEQILSAKRTHTRFTDLSKREMEILRLLAKGETTAKIASVLFISKTTVNNHIQHILKKLGAHTRLEAVRRAEQARLI